MIHRCLSRYLAHPFRSRIQEGGLVSSCQGCSPPGLLLGPLPGFSLCGSLLLCLQGLALEELGLLLCLLELHLSLPELCLHLGLKPLLHLLLHPCLLGLQVLQCHNCLDRFPRYPTDQISILVCSLHLCCQVFSRVTQGRRANMQSVCKKPLQKSLREFAGLSIEDQRSIDL